MLSKTTSLAALALVAALVFTGCAVETVPAPTDPVAEKTAAATSTPKPTVAAGNVVTPEQVEDLTKSGNIIAGYPVGDQLIAVQWGVAIPENVRHAANTAVNAAVGPEHGRQGTADAMTEQQFRLIDVLADEAEKLGGIGLAAIQCAMSFSTITNSYQPTWTITEPGPSGAYGSYQEAHDDAEAWIGGRQLGKAMYIVINNLGCEQ